ncbi:hypothetical protein P691DRAFT_809728 [Macrolepiota fuliginosa MF-IS2]|uniref:Capsid protein n=1 Tax=Macrolepiota fuliginosa MF-IS2 TaxID=1400762 RepID=A0A9P5XJ54_9AGAR|nr:hypothetical protein P691DRAFT_809728 [Macrolepiota fuliginosa MF-IS2]
MTHYVQMRYPFVTGALEGYMAERCERVIDTNTLRSWDLHWFDNMYGPEDPTQDLPFRQIGVIVGWYDTKRADVNGTPLSIAYTFIMTMVYEVESPHVAATRGLLELFYYKLQSYTINAPRGRKYLDMITIQELLYIYATEEFQRAFGFEYRQDATPPDRRLDTVKIFHSMLYINTLPVPVEQVDGWMVSNVIGRNDCQFPSYAQSSIYDEIRDTVLRCAGGGYSATTWYQASVRSFFLNPDQSHPFHMQHFACYLFIRANMTVKVNGKEDQIQYCLVYYLGLFASYSNNAGAKVVQFDPKKVGAPY